MAHPTASRCHRCGARLASDNRDDRCAPCQAAEWGRLTQAPSVPPEFWDDEALHQALTARHMGWAVRAYRHHHYHGRHAIAQDVVASCINAYLLRWVRRKYKRLRGKRKARSAWNRAVQKRPRAFAHWAWVTHAPTVW